MHYTHINNLEVTNGVLDCSGNYTYKFSDSLFQIRVVGLLTTCSEFVVSDESIFQHASMHGHTLVLLFMNGLEL